MSQGLRIPLSPNEEKTLLKVARGEQLRESAFSRDLQRLKNLELVERLDPPRLTSLGKERAGLLFSRL
jgi:hypothetical protein